MLPEELREDEPGCDHLFSREGSMREGQDRGELFLHAILAFLSGKRVLDSLFIMLFTWHWRKNVFWRRMNGVEFCGVACPMLSQLSCSPPNTASSIVHTGVRSIYRYIKIRQKTCWRENQPEKARPSTVEIGPNATTREANQSEN
ncbi:MAG TPA: hypothetical protein VN729_10615 [Ktedonobacteraceae bacterium]|nr:hypothetical protein [Ktedonobacteraceae bacterium]